MFNFHLPLSDEMTRILNNFKIENWEAKSFWKKIKPNNPIDRNDLQSLVYQSLNILSKHGYLKSRRSSFNSRVFLYTETDSLKEYRKRVNSKEIVSSLKLELDKLNKNLYKCRVQLFFISELINNHPKIEGELLNIKNDFNTIYKVNEIKIELLESIIQKYQNPK